MLRPADAAPTLRWARRLARYSRCCRGHAGLAVGAAVGGTTVSAVIPMVERSFMDRVVIAGRSGVPLTVALIGGAILMFAFTALRQRAASKAALEIQYRLRTELFDAFPRLTGQWSAGDVITRTNSDLIQIHRTLLLLPLVVGSTLYLLVAFTCMVVMSWQLSLLVVAVVPLCSLLIDRSRHWLDVANRDAQRATSDLVQSADRAINDVMVVKALGQERREAERFTAAADSALTAQSRLIRQQARLVPALGALTGIAQICAIGLGGLLAARHSLTIGTYLAFCTYLEQTSAPVRVLTTLFGSGRRTRASAIRVFELLDTPAAVRERPGALPAPQTATAVEFRSVGSGNVLDEFSLTVRPGELVAVVGGAPGLAGELHRLLSRYHDCDSGVVAVAGHDVRDLALTGLHGAVALADTDPVLFRGSVSENILIGRGSATKDELTRAVALASAEGLAQDLPLGLDSEVGERGRLLSGGQRQRVALARAFVAAPPVLVLDDPTSAVDPLLEGRILAQLHEGRRDSTTLLVTSRRAAALAADRIVVVEAGAAVDTGTHEELAERCEEYRRFLRGPLGDEPARAGDVLALPAPRSAPPVIDESEGQSPKRPGTDMLKMPWRPLMIGLLLIGVGAGLDLLLPMVVRGSIDNGIRAGSAATVLAVAGIGLAIVMARCAVWVLQIRSTQETGARASRDLRVRVFAHLQRLGMDYYDHQPAGRILTLLTADIDAVAGFLQDGLATTVVQAVSVLGVAAALLALDPRLFTVVLAFLPLLAVSTLVFRRVCGNAYEMARVRLDAVNADFRESLSGVRVLHSCGGWSRARDRYRRLCAEQRTTQQRAQNCAAVYFPVTELCSTGAAVAVMITGAAAVRSGTLSVGALVAGILYIYLLFAPLQKLSQSYDAYRQAAVGLRRLRQLRDAPVLPVDHPGSTPAPPLRGEIVLDRVGFRYPGTDRDALTDVSLRIPVGGSLALVGMSGAGKSTLAKLIARLHDPTTGVVRVDGEDIRSFTVSSYRRRVGLVPQEPRLTAETVREAIRYGSPRADDAQVEIAAAAVGADAAVRRLPGGYAHPADGCLDALSAADRRLIARARAELANPDILLLDEPAGASDALNTAAGRQRTTILIVHELAAAVRADQIAVLEQGRLAELGSHAELLQSNGRYARLWAAYTATNPWHHDKQTTTPS